MTTATADKHGSERALTFAALAVTLLLWASAFVVIRSTGRHLSPGALALTRLVVGSVALGVVMARRRARLQRGRALGCAVICGIAWFGAYNLALNAGEQRLDAGTSSLLVNTGPIFLALLAGAVLRESFPRSLLAGCAVAFCGTTLIAVETSDRGSGEFLGVLLCVVAAICYAIGVVAQKPALRDFDPLPVTWIACTVGAVSLLGFAPSLVHQLGHESSATITGAIYLGLGPTATAFVLWAYALTRTDAGRLGSTTYLVPPIVVLISWLALGQTPPLLALPGGLLCLPGVALASGPIWTHA
jgi:drug/metabolite transporter (DMT)-like permease